MATIMDTLFGVSAERFQQERDAAAEAQALQYARLSPIERASLGVQRGAYGLAGALGGALGGTDPELQRRTQAQQILGMIDPSKPETFFTAAQIAADRGDQQLAFGLRLEGDKYKQQKLIRDDEAAKRLREQTALNQQTEARAIAQRAYQPGTPERAQMLDVQEREQMADQGTLMPENIAAVAPSFDIQRVLPELIRTPEGQAQLKMLIDAEKLMRPEEITIGQMDRRLQRTPSGYKEVIPAGAPKPLTANIDKIGQAAGSGKAVYLDVNNDVQFTYDKDQTGKQVRVPFTGSLLQKVAGESGGAGGAAGTGTVEVVDPNNPTKTIIVTKARAVNEGLTPAKAIEGLTPQMRQNLEKNYPQATSSLRSYQSKTASFIKDVEALRDSAGLESITGLVAGRAPGLSGPGRAAVALYDKVIAKGGFQVLQDMRDMSKTGGALGNISDRENTQLKAAFAAIDRKQNADDVRAALDNLIIELQGSLARVKDAYDLTYEYRRANVAPAASGVDANNPLLKGQ